MNNPPLTKGKGVVNFEGHRETWYSQKKLPGNGLNIPGRHVDDKGLVRDKDGYICVATKIVPKGQTINTSLGMGKRYDTCGGGNTVDIYTNW